MTAEWLRSGDDGRSRCWWPGGDPDYVRYHDAEWGRAVVDDEVLYEKICLEGFQAGLSWLTILRKRANFRAAFAGFDPRVVATFDEADIARLLADAGIVRHRGKIEATIGNASRFLETVADVGSFAAHVWSFVIDAEPGESGHPSGLPTVSPAAVALSRDLKRRGWRFVGPTTMYSFMQSMGVVNDHLPGCWVREECEVARRATVESFR